MLPNQSRSRPSRSDERLEVLEERIDRLERTLTAIAGEAANVSVAGPCPGCQQSLLLARDGMLECPCCEYRRPL
ncbi:hypothetical protein ACYJ1Y_00140 [Natrialbaceae archaeon A-gly3]